ncbi:MAG: DUF2065 domain-containing protein [Gammaproteobacteria bacterium]|nr:DUF2065 domain-containing protein [Gammaproteobacteria bacterium]
MLDWQAFLSAVGLWLIFEGIVPFVNPDGFRRAIEMIKELSDRQLRVAGIVSMVFGLIVLYLVNR